MEICILNLPRHLSSKDTGPKRISCETRGKIPKEEKNIRVAHFRSGSSISASAVDSFLLIYVMGKMWLPVQPLQISLTNTK